jgi:hypothetical protein
LRAGRRKPAGFVRIRAGKADLAAVFLTADFRRSTQIFLELLCKKYESAIMLPVLAFYAPGKEGFAA